MAKKRSSNFTSYEKELLLSLVKNYPVLNNKSCSNEMAQKKKKAWQNITAEFSTDPRARPIMDSNKLKYMLRNMRNRAAKERALVSRGTMKTGGGPYPGMELSHFSQQVNILNDITPDYCSSLNSLPFQG